MLLDNPGGLLPLQRPSRLAVVGPCADDVLSLMGCYAFPNHVGVLHPDMPLGVELPTVLDGVRTEFPAAEVSWSRGVPVQEPDRSGIPAAVAAARDAEVCLAVLGDRAGLFGRGTSGEGCDAPDLRLPGAQAELLDALLDTGTPVVLVLLTGRPYALGEVAGRLAAVVQAFFPGEEGAAAVAGVLSGRVNPSGRLPVQVPRTSAGQPSTYLSPVLGRASGVSSADPTPAFPFGHGLSYSRFSYEDLCVDQLRPGNEPHELPTDGEVELSCTVRNDGSRAGAEVVQLYLHDPVASVVRPVRQLIGFARVELDASEAVTVRFVVHADRTSFTGRDLQRVVEAGAVRLDIGASSEDLRLGADLSLVEPDRVVGHDRVLTTRVHVGEAAVPRAGVH